MKIDKEIIRENVRRSVFRWWESQDLAERGPITHYCWVWAIETVKVLNATGLKAQLQAGTAQWRVCEDDGVNPDWFGYIFEPNAESKLQFLTGNLPEMHCWAAIHPKHCSEGRGQIVDFTVGFQNARAKEFGVIPDRTLPDYLWFYLDRIFPTSRYEPHPLATVMAYKIAGAS